MPFRQEGLWPRHGRENRLVRVTISWAGAVLFSSRLPIRIHALGKYYVHIHMEVAGDLHDILCQNCGLFVLRRSLILMGRWLRTYRPAMRLVLKPWKNTTPLYEFQVLEWVKSLYLGFWH